MEKEERIQTKNLLINRIIEYNINVKTGISGGKCKSASERETSARNFGAGKHAEAVAQREDRAEGGRTRRMLDTQAQRELLIQALVEVRILMGGRKSMLFAKPRGRKARPERFPRLEADQKRGIGAAPASKSKVDEYISWDAS